MTLTFELDLDMIQVDLHVKFLVRMSNGSAVRVLNYRQTDRHTHTQTGPILLPRPLTREVIRSVALSDITSVVLATGTDWVGPDPKSQGE